MANTRCEQDLVGFNPQNTGAVLTIGTPTVVNDALVIDTRAIPGYTGTVSMNIANELGMTAVFMESGTTSLSKVVSAGNLLYIPLRVTATDCGYDRCGYWQFTVYYDSDPYYGANTGGEDPDPCGKPDRKIKVCRFDARWPNKCFADFSEKLVNVTGSGTYTTRFNLGQSPQCTGSVRVRLDSECVGISFPDEQPGTAPPTTMCDPIVTRQAEIPLSNGNINDLEYVGNLNEIWACDSANDRINRIDPITNASLGNIAMTAGDAPVSLIYLPGYDKVYVSANGNNTVRIIDTNTLAVTTITGAVGTGPQRFVQVVKPGVDVVYLTCSTTFDVFEIDVATDTTTGVAIATLTAGSLPTDIVYVQTRDELWVAGLNGNIDRIDISGVPAVLSQLACANVFRMSMSPVEVFGRANGTVFRINIATLNITSFSVAGNGGIAYYPFVGNFILNQSLNLMYLYNTDSTPVLLNTYTTGLAPRELLIDEINLKLFVSDLTNGEVTPYEIRNCANPGMVVTNGGATLEVVLPYSYADSYFDFNFDYSGEEINCYCDIRATIEYASCNNPNLVTSYNGGTMSGYVTQAQFNTAGITSRTATVFQSTLNPVAGTALRTTISTPPDYTNRPLPNVPVASSATDGSIVWQGDISTPWSVTSGERYWLKAKARMPANAALPPLIRANEEVHLDRYFVAGSGLFNPAIPYFTQYTPWNQWHDIGIRWQSLGGSITPFVRYVQTFLPTALVGDLYLNDGGVSDWANVELTRYYPSDCIECPDRSMRVIREDCEYNTYLGITENTECESIDFEDLSDFGYEPGHDRSDFTIYRKLTATGADGNQTILASQNPYNIYIPPAAGDTAPPLIYSAYPVADLGYYEFTLCNVPTFNTGTAYPVGTNVVLFDTNGIPAFYECIDAQPGFIPGLTTGWQFVWKQISESQLADKYCDTQYYVQLCGLLACINEYKNKLICSLDYICSANLCDNECLMNFFELEMIYQVSQYENPETQLGCWTGPDYRDILNYSKKLCSTCNCQ